MEMLVDAQLIRNERLKRAWSQEHLAQVTGLGIRTVQRIESGGNASLETVKALAAVLELSTEALLTEAPAQSIALLHPTPVSSSRFRLFRPWPAFAAGCTVTLVTLGSFFNMQGAAAEQIGLDFAVTLNGEKVSVSRMTSEDGSPAVVEVTELVKINLVPSVSNDGRVLVKAEVYTSEDGEFKLVSSPALLTDDKQPVLFRVGNEAGFNGDAAMMLEVLVTPTIE